MRGLRQFFRNFLSNKGQYVFLALLIAKICAFLSSLLIIRLLPEQQFGKISLVASVFAVFASASGLGSYQSLLRFGSVVKSEEDRRAVSAHLLKQGFLYHLIVTIFFLVASLFFLKSFKDIFSVFLFFGVRLIGVYFQNHIQSYLRVAGNNQAFAQSSNVINILGLFLVVLLAYFAEFYGYLLAIAITPFLSLFWLKREMITSTSALKFKKAEIWNYAFYTAGTALLSDALFAADTVLLGFLMNENAVANYRVAILIPANLTFLALVFMQTDFPVLAANYQNKNYLKNYIVNYYKIFLPVSIGIFALFFYFKAEILTLFFSAQYAGNSFIFLIFTFAFLINILMRNLYGNLLSAVGKMNRNTVVSVISVLTIITLAFLLVPRFAETGMALALSLTMVFSGLLLMFYFYRYLRSLP